MSAPRRNEVFAIEPMAGWLYVPLTPVRAARLASFEVRHGNIMPFLLDALDDIVFDTGRQPGGTDRRPDDTTPPSTQRTA